MSGIRPRSSDTTHELDLRTLAPAATIDANGNTGRSAFDPLGRAVAGGQEGHVGAQPWGSGALGAWTAPADTTLTAILADPRGFLGTAASATWTDDRAWEERQAPVAVVSVARAALVHDGDGGGAADGPLEVAVRYLDGFGRVLQEKVRVEPGPAITRDASGAVVVDAQGPVLAHTAERYRVSGHVVYDAKGQPIRVFEPYFSPVAGYEADAVLQAFGVSTLTSYDAAGRPVRVDHPNGTYERVRYRPWSTEASTPGDNVLDSAYRVLREGRAPDDAERVAYEHAASHAGTPTVTHVDARGTVCLTVAVGDATAEARRVRQVTDASGQVTTTIDPRGLVAFRYWRDLRGRVLATDSVDAGPAWSLPDGFDRPALGWDARGHRVVRSFDVADRPVAVQVYDGDGATPLDHVVEAYRYGDEEADRASARAANTLGRLVTVKDEAGELRTTSYDPAGAPRSSERLLRQGVDDAPDWRQAVAVEAEALTSAAVTDALGRVVWQRFADGSERRDSYHVGGALAAVTVTTPDGALVAAPVVSGLARDARGRIAGAQLGNGCVQAWRYDRDTGRLVAQDATHGGRALQRLRFTYDADGKLVRALDLAQDGASAVLPSAVSARRDYVYDVHGRLVEATGRVHQALLPHDYIPGTAGTMSGTRHLSLDNGAALERYTQRFTYDASGNLLRVQHVGTTASWATDYWVAGGSNRSTAALDPNGLPVVNPAGMFDATGNLRELAHLRSMAWSWRGCLARAVTIARTGGVDDDERYAYGADRMRVRKVATRVVGGGSVETREVVYAGDQERVRVRRDGVVVLERWTTHVGDGERRVAVVDRHTVDTLGHEVDQVGPARVRYHLTTPQGSTALELSETGGIISYEEYLPHGGSAFIAGDSARDVARRDVRYAGKERDRATGLHAYPYRYYAPWLGRWLSPDPIGPEDDLNLYQFVLGDPVGNVDPEGLDTPLAGRTQDQGHWQTKEEAIAGGNKNAAKTGRWVVDAEVESEIVVNGQTERTWRARTEPYVGQELFQDDPNSPLLDPGRKPTLIPFDGVKPQVAPEPQPLPAGLAPVPEEATHIENDLHGDPQLLAPNEHYDRYGSLNESAVVDGQRVTSITSDQGTQFRIIDSPLGHRTYQVDATVTGRGGAESGWHDVSRERFEYFRNVAYAHDLDPAGWSARSTLADKGSSPRDYFSGVLTDERRARERFLSMWHLPGWMKTMGVGGLAILAGVLTFGAGTGLVAALSLGGGTAATVTGGVQAVRTLSGETSPEKDDEVADAAMTAAGLSQPAALVGGTLGTLAFGGQRGLQTGIALGNVAEFGYGLFRGLRGAAPASRSSRPPAVARKSVLPPGHVDEVAACEFIDDGLPRTPPQSTVSNENAAAATSRLDPARQEAQRRLVELLQMRERQLALAWDEAIGKPRLLQGAGGARLERAVGRRISVSDDSAVDFVDAVLGKISLKGPLPPGRPIAGLIDSVAKDLRLASGTDTLVVDLYGMSFADAERVRAAVVALHVQYPTKRLFFLLEVP